MRRYGPAARLSINNVEAAISAAVAGLGVIRTLSYQVVDEIASGRLELLLTDEATQTLPLSLLFQGGRRHHPNVRAFVEAAKRRLQGVEI